MKLELLKEGGHIMFADRELICNEKIRMDPEFTHFPDLSKQSLYRIKVTVPYVTNIRLEQMEGGQRTGSGRQVHDVSAMFSSIGSTSSRGYNKCRITITFSDGKTYTTRCDASPRDYSLEKQLDLIFGSHYWVGRTTEDGYVY